MAGITVGIPIEIQDGSVADVITIREYVTDSVNVSAGYYNPHSDDEYVNLEEITKIIKWLRLFVNNEKERCQ
jgi:di/tripeptidase